MYWIDELIDMVDHRYKAIAHAKDIGTYDADDRSKQYPLEDRTLEHKAINECWTKVHALEAANRKKDQQINDLLRKADRSSVKIWLLTFAVGIEGALLGWFATSLLDCLQAGRHATALLR